MRTFHKTTESHVAKLKINQSLDIHVFCNCGEKRNIAKNNLTDFSLRDCMDGTTKETNNYFECKKKTRFSPQKNIHEKHDTYVTLYMPKENYVQPQSVFSTQKHSMKCDTKVQYSCHNYYTGKVPFGVPYINNRINYHS